MSGDTEGVMSDVCGGDYEDYDLKFENLRKRPISGWAPPIPPICGGDYEDYILEPKKPPIFPGDYKPTKLTFEPTKPPIFEERSISNWAPPIPPICGGDFEDYVLAPQKPSIFGCVPLGDYKPTKLTFEPTKPPIFEERSISNWAPPIPPICGGDFEDYVLAPQKPSIFGCVPLGDYKPSKPTFESTKPPIFGDLKCENLGQSGGAPISGWVPPISGGDYEDYEPTKPLFEPKKPPIFEDLKFENLGKSDGATISGRVPPISGGDYEDYKPTKPVFEPEKPPILGDLKCENLGQSGWAPISGWDYALKPKETKETEYGMTVTCGGDLKCENGGDLNCENLGQSGWAPISGWDYALKPKETEYSMPVVSCGGGKYLCLCDEVGFELLDLRPLCVQAINCFNKKNVRS
ncbi:hypothetical protein COLO4_31709 [Corchorus olitorius]|uniref:Uncharacterized protein n=1 Tax=Corchorus olitorius TaxID=93759 RepID=A0A1R3H3J5_9ROSI|nr:hypothetical protein COLO4_31709 [Corchorus olitorius]